MKIFNSIFKSYIPMLSILACLFVSCKDDLPSGIDSSDKFTVLKSIRIVNAGEDGDIVLEGIVDEDKKEISFPRIAPETDFNNLRFEADLSDGAKLDKESYVIEFAEGQTERSITIKVMNEPRFREYNVNLRLKVPVFGADFSKINVYDYTANAVGQPTYPAFTGTLTRGSGFDGEYVLIISRGGGGLNPHVIKVEDVKNNLPNPPRIDLNMTGVSGGTFPYNVGAMINGHIYMVNLASGIDAGPIYLYHWETPTSAPSRIASLSIGATANGRFGDGFSMDLDENGNGFVYLGNNNASSTTLIMRAAISNYTTVGPVVTFPPPTTNNINWVYYNRIGNTSEYLFTGVNSPISLVNDEGTSSYNMSIFTAPSQFSTRATDPRIVNFNGERYLITTTSARYSGEAIIFKVYDITRGSSIKEALEILNGQPNHPTLYEFNLSGPFSSAPTTQTGFYIKKDGSGNDETLMLYTASTDAGFVLFEVPKKVAED